MKATLCELKEGVNQPSLTTGRVGTRNSTVLIESYLRRAHTLFGGGKASDDMVMLLEVFYCYKCGHDGNMLKSASAAVAAVIDFLEFCREPLWRWTSEILYEYITSLKVKGLAGQTMRARHLHIEGICDAVLADLALTNKLKQRHFGASFQQITNTKSRALVRGFGQRKKVLSNPTPMDMQRVYDYLESEILEAMETGGAMPWVLFRDRMIISMFDAYGLRLTELINIDTTHFDYDPECPEYCDLGILHVIGKGNKIRHLPIMTEWIYPVLRVYIDEIRSHWASKPKIKDEDTHALFLSNEGKRMSTTRVQSIIKTRFQQAGIAKDISPHRLRNGTLTRLTDKVGLSTASRVAGHLHASTTEGYYDRKASMSGDALSQYVNKIYKSQLTETD